MCLLSHRLFCLFCLQKNFFRRLEPQFGLEIRGGGGVGGGGAGQALRAPPLDPPLIVMLENVLLL